MCFNYSSLRLCFNNESIDVYPCCILEQDISYKPLYTFNMHEILDIPKSIFVEKLLDIYKNGKLIKTPDICLTRLQFPVKEDICKWNIDSIREISVSCTRTCNLSCYMCRDNIIINELADEVYYYILDALKLIKIKILHLTESGEPFYYKERALNYLETLTIDNCEQLFIVSNLTLLNDNDIERLSTINKRITINMAGSIDGITEQTYKSIRHNNLFNKVMHNAELLIQKNILKQVNFVVQDLNIHELNAAYNFWKNKNVIFVPIVINDYKDIGHNTRILNSIEYKNFSQIFK